jgi:translation initiation factor eIF-2B subunit epsilon
LEEKHDVDIAALELNTLKMAMDIGFDHLRQIVIPSLLSRIDPTKGTAAMKQVLFF